jgi:hypothetical protein
MRAADMNRKAFMARTPYRLLGIETPDRLLFIRPAE